MLLFTQRVAFLLTAHISEEVSRLKGVPESRVHQERRWKERYKGTTPPGGRESKRTPANANSSPPGRSWGIYQIVSRDTSSPVSSVSSIHLFSFPPLITRKTDAHASRPASGNPLKTEEQAEGVLHVFALSLSRCLSTK